MKKTRFGIKYKDVLMLLLLPDYKIYTHDNKNFKCTKDTSSVLLVSKLVFWIIADSFVITVLDERRLLISFWISLLVAIVVNIIFVIPIYAWRLLNSNTWVVNENETTITQCKHKPVLKWNLQWICSECGSKLILKSKWKNYVESGLRLINISIMLALLDVFEGSNIIYLSLCILIPCVIWWVMFYFIEKIFFKNSIFETRESY